MMMHHAELFEHMGVGHKNWVRWWLFVSTDVEEKKQMLLLVKEKKPIDFEEVTQIRSKLSLTQLFSFSFGHFMAL